MIRRDKENRNLRLLRRERLNERLDKMHKGRRIPHNTTAEDMEKDKSNLPGKEHSEQKHTAYEDDADYYWGALLHWWVILSANSAGKVLDFSIY